MTIKIIKSIPKAKELKPDMEFIYKRPGSSPAHLKIQNINLHYVFYVIELKNKVLDYANRSLETWDSWINEGYLTWTTKPKITVSKICNCELEMLMYNGCKCGAITPYRLRV